MARDSCLARVTAGVALGGAIGGAVGDWGNYKGITPWHCHFLPLFLFPLSRPFSMWLKILLGRGFQWAKEKWITGLFVLIYGGVAGCISSGLFKASSRLAQGAVYGTYEAVRYKVPGLMKIRYIGQTTVGSAAIFGIFLGAGSLIHCGRSY